MAPVTIRCSSVFVRPGDHSHVVNVARLGTFTTSLTQHYIDHPRVACRWALSEKESPLDLTGSHSVHSSFVVAAVSLRGVAAIASTIASTIACTVPLHPRCLFWWLPFVVGQLLLSPACPTPLTCTVFSSWAPLQE